MQCSKPHRRYRPASREDDGLSRDAAKIKAQHSLSLADAFAVATAEKQKSTLVRRKRQRVWWIDFKGSQNKRMTQDFRI